MPPETQSALMTMARSSSREVCGFIDKDWEVHPIKNVAVNDRDFKMDEQEQIEFFRNYFTVMTGVYHSHPGGRREPSEKDITYAPARLRYWIVTRTEVIEWEIKDGVATEVTA